MNNDFDLIVNKFSTTTDYINVYPLGDVHVGSQQFNEKLFLHWIEIVKSDPNSVVVMVGDLIDNGLKTSKTNSYDATMSPREQVQRLKEYLKPIKNKILCSVAGNHELRSTVLTDECPLYNVMDKLDLEHLYRENMGFVKLSLGEKNSERQFSYTLVLAHGGSKNKTNNFSYAIEGMDVMISGHDHKPASNFPAKIVIDPRNDKVTMKGYINITVPSFQDFGGYAVRGLYMPQDNKRFPVIKLYGDRKEMELLWRV